MVKRKQNFRQNLGCIAGLIILGQNQIVSGGGPSRSVQGPISSIGYRPSEELSNGIFGSLMYSADNKTLVAAAGDGTVRLYDAITAREKSTFKMESSTEGLKPSARIWSHLPDSWIFLMNGYSSNDLQLVDARSGNIHLRLEKLDQAMPLLQCAAFSSDGRLVAAGYQDTGEVVVWDAITGRRRFKTKAHVIPSHTEPFPRAVQPIPAPILALTFSPDASLLLSSSLGAPLRCWDVAIGAEVAPPIRITNPGMIAPSPDHKFVVMSERADDGEPSKRKYLLYDMTSWKKLSEWTAGVAVRLALLQGGRQLIWMKEGGIIQLRDANSGRVFSELDVQLRGPSECMAVSPDSKRIAVGGFNDHPVFGAIQLIEIDKTTLRLWKHQP